MTEPQPPTLVAGVDEHQEVTPWTVKTDSVTGIDYNKLVDQFGSTQINEDLIKRIEKVTGKPCHHFLKRGLFFSHRDLDLCLNLQVHL